MSKVMIVMGILVFLGGLFGLFINRKNSKRFMVFMGMLYLMAGACAFFLVENRFEMPKSDVQITLSDLDGQADSVFLSQVQIDGEEYQLEHMKAGNWVWQNNCFGWKNASGTVLEEIDTNVIVEIPIGYTRILKFNANADTGKIQIKEGSDTVEQVLHRGENSIRIKSTPQKQIYKAKLFKIAVFVILFAIFIIIIKLLKKYWDSISTFCKKNRFYLILLFLVILSFLFMWRYAGYDSFWGDEVYTVGFLQGTERTNSAWIVSALLRAWISVAPYGQKYLLLPEIIAVVCSVYFIGMIGKRISNERCGIIASTLVGFSQSICLLAAFEFRFYAFVLFFSIVTFYIFLIRNNIIKYKWFFCILYGVCLLLLMDSHEYGKVLAACYLIVDIILTFGKKINVRYLLTWIIPFLYGIYWIFNNDLGGLWNNYTWPVNPTIETVADTFLNLCNQQWILVGLFVCGVIYVIKLFIDYLKRAKTFAQVDKYLYLLCLIVGIFACSIIYSNYINPENSLYVYRYFVSVIAYIYLIIAITVNKIIEYATKADTRYVGKNMITICVVVLLMFNGWQTYRDFPIMRDEDYRGSAEWMKNQEDVYDRDVAIVFGETKHHAMGWQYYFNQGKDRHLSQMIIGDSSDIQDLPYRRIYVISLHTKWKIPEYIYNNYQMIGEKTEYGIEIFERKTDSE